MTVRFALIACLLSAAAAESKPRPNVLFLFTDDQRFDTIHALGNERIKTPNIDRLVENGLSFTNAYIMGANSMAVCTPSRACLFSGRTLWNLESQGPWDFAIPERYTTMTGAFLKDGYTCFAAGKNDPGFGKNDHFFRSFNAGDNLYYRGGHRGQNQTPLFSIDWDADPPAKEKQKPDGTFNADLFAEAAVEFLEKRNDGDPPFFAYVSFMTPHDPLNCPEEFMKLYAGEDMKLPANYLPEHPFDAGVHDIRDEKLMKRPLTEDGVRDRLAKYYALVTHTDAQIGRILEALARSGEADNTIVVFSSDNGLALGSHGLTGKQSVYEHSVRVPLVIAGPGIPKGERREQLCYIYDVYPTLCERADVEIPDTVQFRSLDPVIADPEASHRDHLYFGFMSWHRAVRDDRHKLISYSVNGESHTQLFDLETDPGETRNLAGEKKVQPVLKRMRKLLESERDRLNDGKADAEHINEMSKAFWETYRQAAE
ncbi:choline-sulfatase [Haloferula helveola]|uniref:Choline-sulfatase n=1 Tax=Haloferula helveola TaxID=490095 RepID=A0ABM7R7V7_9BACT|nr:choline-sulfatase [Haloferula helveola]